MPLESASFISQLVPANPVHTDLIDQGDAHMRLIKAVLQSQFPNFTAAALNSTQAQIDGIAQHAVGAMFTFPKVPSSFQSGGGTGTGATYLECDGSVYNVVDYPALGAFLGSTFGGNGSTTFGVPQLKDTGRYIRSRTGSLAVGTTQANQAGAHTHTATSTVTDPGHVHTITDNGHSHNSSEQVQNLNISGGGGGGAEQADTTYNSGHTQIPTNSVTTGITINSHTTGITVATTNANNTTDASGETRPETFIAVMCIKT